MISCEFPIKIFMLFVIYIHVCKLVNIKNEFIVYIDVSEKCAFYQGDYLELITTVTVASLPSFCNCKK